MKNDRFKAFQEGRKEAFEFYFTEFERSVFHFILRSCKDRDLASEFTQKAFIKLFENRAKMNDEAHLLRFLLFVARNIFRQYLRAAKAERGAAIELSHISDARFEGDDTEMDRDDILRRLGGAVKRLSPQRRMVVEMYFFQGLKVREIARELAIAEQTVRNTLRTSLILLRKEMPPLS